MKKVKLRAFQITNFDINNAYSDLGELLIEKLISSETVDNRRMRLNAEDRENEDDLISFFQVKQDIVFCTMLRVQLGNNVQHIASDLFKKKSFTIDELNNSSVEGGAIYKNSYYFSISDNFLITNLQKNIPIKGLETYLHWFLEKYYQITPMIDIAQITQLSEIKSITVVDNLSNVKNLTNDISKSTSLTVPLNEHSIPIVKNLLNDTHSISDAQLEELISVKLLINFRKIRKTDPIELQNALGALLKPVSDLENLVFEDKNRNKIKTGESLPRVKTVSIETTGSGFLNENQLLQEMYAFIRELKNEP